MYIFGRNAVLEALAAGKQIEKIFCQFGTEGAAITALRIQAEKANIPFSLMDKRKFYVLERETCGEDGKSQGVIALVAAVKTFSITELIEQAFSQTENPLFVALDGITDPHNLGAIGRSAECAGFHGLIIPDAKSAPLSGAAMKTSAGALQHIPVTKTGAFVKALEDCRNAGFRLLALEADAKKEYAQVLAEENLSHEPLVLVVGSEGEGIQPAVKRICTDSMAIPQRGKISSLNASVAAAVVMFEILRQRENTTL